MALLTACLVFVGLPALATEYDDDFVTLPFTRYGDMLVDRARDRVFMTGNTGSSEVAVVALDGTGVTTIPGTPGASGMSMTDDGTKLYVALEDGDGIAEIDTATLAVRRIDTGAGSCPSDLAVGAGYVWFTASRWAGGGCSAIKDLMRLDPTTGTVSPDVRTYSDDEVSMWVLPGTTRLLYTSSGTHAAARLFDVADGALSQVGYVDLGTTYGEAVLTSDGQHFVVPQYGSVAFHRTSDLSADGVTTFPAQRYVYAAAVDGDVLATSDGSEQVEVRRRSSGAQLNDVVLGPTDPGGVMEVDLLGDRMLAVTQDYSGVDTVRLYQVDRPTVPAPELTVELPAEAEVGRPATVSGSLTNQGVPVPNAEVTVRQEGFDSPLGTAVTDALGRYSMEVVPGQTGSVPLVAGYAGDALAKSAKAKATLTVVRRAVELTMGAPASVWPDEPLTLSGTLFDDGEPLEGVSLRLSRRCTGWAHWEQLDSPVTQAGGAFSVTVQPGTTGPWGPYCESFDYAVWYAGDDLRRTAEATARVAVTWRHPSMQVNAPNSATVGDPVTISGTITAQDGPLADSQVTARVTTPTQVRELGTLTTDSAGRFETVDVTEEAGSHCYRILYQGDSRTRVAYVDRCVGVTKLPSDLTMNGPLSAGLDEAVVVSGWLRSGGEAVPDVQLAVSRTDSFQGAQTLAPTRTAANGFFTFRDTPPNGGQVHYAVSYAGSQTRAAAATSWIVDVRRPDRTLSLNTDRSLYNYGDTAQIEVELTTDSARTARVYAQELGRARTLLYAGDVPEAGLTLQRTMRRKTEFSVQVPEDGRANAAQTSMEVLTRAGLTTKALGWYAKSGTYHLYRPTADGRFAATVKPFKSEGCVGFEVQRRYPDGWRRAAGQTCVPIEEASTATWTYGGTQPTRTPYRVRATFVDDTVNTSKTGSWVYFKYV